MNRKIAFLGSSLSMAFMVDALRGNSECTVFESGFLGGAWAEKSLGNIMVPLACNGIGSSESDLEGFRSLEEHLIDHGAVLKLCQGTLPGTPYKEHDYHLVGRVGPAIRQMHSGATVNLLAHNVREILVREDKVLLDGAEFAGLFFPEHFRVKRLEVLGSDWTVNPSSVTSQHLRIKFRGPIEASHYDVEWDNVFDRAGIQYPSGDVFVGRIRQEFKMIDTQTLISKSEWLAVHRRSITHHDRTAYLSHWISEHTLEDLRGALESTTSRLVPTQSIHKAYGYSQNLSSMALEQCPSSEF